MGLVLYFCISCSNLPNTIFEEITFSLDWLDFTWQALDGCRYVGPFLEFLFCSIDLHVLFLCQFFACLITTSLFSSLDVWHCNAAGFALFFKISLVTWNLLLLHMAFNIIFSQIWEEFHQYFDCNHILFISQRSLDQCGLPFSAILGFHMIISVVF